MRPGHLASLASILDDPEASANDRFVAFDLLKNANIAAGKILPMCQDTGTAIVMGKKGQRVWTGGGDAGALAAGIRRTYTETNLRYSQVAPLSMYEEVNTGDNLPAQIELYAEPGDAYKFLFIAKGGGSANKSFLYQQTKAVLNPKSLIAFLDKQIRTLGTAACPPYHLAINDRRHVGRTDPEDGQARELPLSSTPCRPRATSSARPIATAGSRRRGIRLHPAARHQGPVRRQVIAAMTVRVIRLPRHGASLPIGIGVSCSAEPPDPRQDPPPTASILEQLEEPTPRKYLPEIDEATPRRARSCKIDLGPADEQKPARSCRRYPIKTRLSLSGTLIVARDIAHAKLQERLDRGESLPQYVKDHPIYYAGPAKTPEGYASGSFGPTTAGRMDSYLAPFMAAGGSFVSLAKGNRGAEVRDACRKYGGFYLGSIGGPAAQAIARTASRRSSSSNTPSCSLEAIWRWEVVDFPAFIVVDDKGNDFFAHRDDLGRRIRAGGGSGVARLAQDAGFDALLNGDRQAWEAFVRRYAGLIVSAVRGVAHLVSRRDRGLHAGGLRAPVQR